MYHVRLVAHGEYGYNIPMRLLSILLSIIFPETHDEKVTASTRLLTPEPLVVSPRGSVQVLTCARYDTVPVRAAIKVLKKHGTPHAAALLATLLSDVLLEEFARMSLWDTGDFVIVPMPVSARRRRERGFNQVERVLAVLPESLRAHVVPDVLVRVRHAPMQKALSRDERLRNVVGSFAVADERRVAGSRVLLVDDVIATGATMAEAVQVLRRAGAHVEAIALARA